MVVPPKLLHGILAIAIAVGVGAKVAWEWQANVYGKKLSDQSAEYSTEKSALAAANSEQLQKALYKQQLAEQAVADLDKKTSKERSDDLAKNELLRKQYDNAQADNAKLRGDVAAGDRRLRIAASCPSSVGIVSVPKTSSSTSVGDATTVELAPAAGRIVFDIRAGIIADQTALKAAQLYIQNVCQ